MNFNDKEKKISSVKLHFLPWIYNNLCSFHVEIFINISPSEKEAKAKKRLIGVCSLKRPLMSKMTLRVFCLFFPNWSSTCTIYRLSTNDVDFANVTHDENIKRRRGRGFLLIFMQIGTLNLRNAHEGPGKSRIQQVWIRIRNSNSKNSICPRPPSER